MKKSRLVLLALALLTFNGSPGFSANWRACNGTPVRVKYAPMGIFWDQCSVPEGSRQETAFSSALRETRFYASALGFGSGFRRVHNDQCLIEHDNDRSDFALVNRADIDGRLGLTMTEDDGCTFSWEEQHIVTADVMIANDLNFERADESRVITTAPIGTGARIGAMAILHELGHALGLGHSSAFSVMRDGLAARVPFAGMTPGSGGLSSELTGDDVFGISKIYGFDPSYRNVFVSSQLLRGGVIVDNNIDPTKGDSMHPDPLPVCPGDKVNFYATIGNNSSVREQLQGAVYADAGQAVYFFPTSPPRDLFNIALNRGEFTFPVQYTVPGSMPANVNQSLYVSLQTTMAWDRKGYDNSARSRLRIRRKPGC